MVSGVFRSGKGCCVITLMQATCNDHGKMTDFVETSENVA